jgi:hypothetical protein
METAFVYVLWATVHPAASAQLDMCCTVAVPGRYSSVSRCQTVAMPVQKVPAMRLHLTCYIRIGVKLTQSRMSGSTHGWGHM